MKVQQRAAFIKTNVYAEFQSISYYTSWSLGIRFIFYIFIPKGIKVTERESVQRVTISSINQHLKQLENESTTTGSFY